MNLTSRSRYALKIMLDLARHQHGDVVKRHDIVHRQGVPSNYLDQILIRLRRDDLVISVRGRLGGYRIGRPAADISVWEVFRAVEDGIYPVECVDEHDGCAFQSQCISNDPWKLIFSTLRESLENTKLDVFEREAGWDIGKVRLPAGIQECKPGREPFRSLQN